jgi:hypothetical protein
MDFLREFWLFVKTRKKYWLLPILIASALFAALIVLGEGSAIAPFIYAIF